MTATTVAMVYNGVVGDVVGAATSRRPSSASSSATGSRGEILLLHSDISSSTFAS
jgi:hypothetical protein